MKTYTIFAKEIGLQNMIPLGRARMLKDDAMKAAWRFSFDATLCDVVLRCGSKHVATYRKGKMIEYLGKAHQQ